MTAKKKHDRVRARTVLVGDVFKPIREKLDDPTATKEQIVSTIVDIVDADEDRLIRLPEVIDMSGLKRSEIYRKMDQGTFPGSVSLGGTGRRPAVGWHLREVRAWLRKRERTKT